MFPEDGYRRLWVMTVRLDEGHWGEKG